MARSCRAQGPRLDHGAGRPADPSLYAGNLRLTRNNTCTAALGSATAHLLLGWRASFFRGLKLLREALDPDPFPRHSLRHAVYAALLRFGFETARCSEGLSRPLAIPPARWRANNQEPPAVPTALFFSYDGARPADCCGRWIDQNVSPPIFEDFMLSVETLLMVLPMSFTCSLRTVICD